MARPKKTFEQYILQEDAHSRKYVNQESYLKSPATAFLKYTVEAKDAINMCINHFPKKTNENCYTQASEDSLRYLVVALLPAIMGHFETYEKMLFAGMYENSVYLKNFDVRKFHKKLSEAAEKTLTIDLDGISPYREVNDFSVGMMLADNLKNWSSPEHVCKYFRCFVNYELFSQVHKQQLGILWQLRHSIVHNGGTITRADSQKVGALNSFPNKNIILDKNFIYEVSRKMHEIVKESTVGIGIKYIEQMRSDIDETKRKKVETFFEVKSSVSAWMR